MGPPPLHQAGPTPIIVETSRKLRTHWMLKLIELNFQINHPFLWLMTMSQWLMDPMLTSQLSTWMRVEPLEPPFNPRCSSVYIHPHKVFDLITWSQLAPSLNPHCPKSPSSLNRHCPQWSHFMGPTYICMASGGSGLWRPPLACVVPLYMHPCLMCELPFAGHITVEQPTWVGCQPIVINS